MTDPETVLGNCGLEVSLSLEGGDTERGQTREEEKGVRMLNLYFDFTVNFSSTSSKPKEICQMSQQ